MILGSAPVPYISVWVLIPSMLGGGEVIADALVSGTPWTSVGVDSTSVGATSVAFVIAVAVGRASVGKGSGAGDFVGSDLGGSRVGEGSTPILATTLASGVGVSAV